MNHRQLNELWMFKQTHNLKLHDGVYTMKSIDSDLLGISTANMLWTRETSINSLGISFSRVEPFYTFLLELKFLYLF